MCCDAITSKLLITHYFVVEFSSIVMLWLQNWWLPTILWDCDRTHMHCDAVTSKMMIDHYFVDRFFVLPLFRGPNSTNAVRRAHEIKCVHENTIQHRAIISCNLITTEPSNTFSLHFPCSTRYLVLCLKKGGWFSSSANYFKLIILVQVKVSYARGIRLQVLVIRIT